jgi:hypothetical protein
MLFQHRVIEKLGKAGIRAVFERPPTTTQQVLHPEKYFAGVQAARPTPAAIAPHGYRKAVDGQIGELDHKLLLRQYAGAEAEKLAESWRGGAYAIHEKGRGGRAVLSYASEWESDGAAAEYLEAYRKVLQGKWKKFSVSSEGAGTLRGEGDNGFFSLEVKGNKFFSSEGLEQAP